MWAAGEMQDAVVMKLCVSVEGTGRGGGGATAERLLLASGGVSRWRRVVCRGGIVWCVEVPQWDRTHVVID